MLIVVAYDLDPGGEASQDASNMERSVLQTILQAAPRAEEGDEGFTFDDDHHASLLISTTSGTSVGGLIRISLRDDFVEAEAKDRVHFLPYEIVQGVSIRAPRVEAPRTGF